MSRDVLINNAASFFAGYFEELTPAQMDLQLATSLVGPMNVTRAVLPIMRKQRAGQIISISSSAGLIGFEFCTAYSASKFGLEGWIESLQAEIAPFGLQTMIVNPGFFRTELLTEESDGDVLPQRFIAGVDAISTAEQKVALLQQQIDAQRELSSSLAFDDLPRSAAEASA
jgi:NAD(P)-dependent dehydrogenase (short-subunit alcohol dehydrogenase family)